MSVQSAFDRAVEADPPIGVMLRTIWMWVSDEIHVAAVEAGYHDLTPAHLMLFRYPTLNGRRPSELAAQLQMSRQYVNDLLGQLERLGYVVRGGPDPNDRRARVIYLTANGRVLERRLHTEVRNAHRRIAAKLGVRRFNQLRRLLEDIFNEVVPPGELSSSKT